MKRYKVFDWEIGDRQQQGIDARAKFAGGTLIEVLRVDDVRELLKAHPDRTWGELLKLLKAQP